MIEILNTTTNFDTYTEQVYFSKTGNNLSEENYFDQVFDAADIDKAFLKGMNSFMSKNILNKIFSLNRQYLMYCRMQKLIPNKIDRLNYIIEKWNG